MGQMSKNWSVAVSGNSLQVALAARGGLFEYLGAAHLLADSQLLSTVATCVLDSGKAIAGHFKPAPELLLIELCLAILEEDLTARRDIARIILCQPQETDFYSLERGQAQGLAALLEMDYSAAERHSRRLQASALKGEFGKAESRMAGFWGEVLYFLARKDLSSCFTWLAQAHDEFLCHLDFQLGRLKKGRDVGISAFDLVDWPAHATLKLLAEQGYSL
jgi:hypothetical protein